MGHRKVNTFGFNAHKRNIQKVQRCLRHSPVGEGRVRKIFLKEIMSELNLEKGMGASFF